MLSFFVVPLERSREGELSCQNGRRKRREGRGMLIAPKAEVATVATRLKANEKKKNILDIFSSATYHAVLEVNP